MRYACLRTSSLLFEISCPIEVAGKAEGSITVGYTEKPPENPWCSGVFLNEESDLIKTLGNMIGSRISAFETQAELEKSQKSLLKAQSIAQMGSWTFDPKTQKLYGSNEYLKMLHWDGGELTWDAQNKLVHPDDLPAMLEARAKGQAGQPYDVEIRFRLDSGDRWFHSLGEPQLDPAGNIKEILGVTQDITDRKNAEQKLQFQNDIIKETGRIAKIGGWTFDVISGVVYWTDEISRIYDVEDSFVPDLDSSLRLFSSRSKAILQKAVQDAIAHGKPYDLELELISGKGVRKWVRTIGYPVSEKGRVIQLRGSFQDITERIEANQALVRERSLLRTILTTLPDVIWLKDGDGYYRFCNERFEQLKGKKEFEIVGHTDFDLAPRELAERVRGLDLQALQSKTPLIHEEWRDFADGHRELHEVVKVPTYDPAGELIGVLGIARNITLQREAEETLRRFNTELEGRVNARTAELATRTREFELLVQSIPDTVLRVDALGKILFSKKSSEGGFDLIEWCGCCKQPGCVACGLIDLGIEAGKHSAAAPAGGTIVERDLPGGVVVELRVAPLAEGDYPILARDISARRKLEEETKIALKSEKELSTLKSRFISVTSHEFRTPVAAIAGSIDILQNFGAKVTEAKRAELFTRIAAGTDRLKSLIDDVLILSRMDAGRFELNCTSTDLEGLFKEVIEEAIVGDKHCHKFVFNVSQEIRPVFTDSKILHHVLANLISNAIRYSPLESVVQIELGHEGERWWFAVEDQGIGVPEADRIHLFEPFFRATNVGQIRGTGLGLNIVKRYVELLGGEIALIPSITGARFLVSFPLSSKLQ